MNLQKLIISAITILTKMSTSHYVPALRIPLPPISHYEPTTSLKTASFVRKPLALKPQTPNECDVLNDADLVQEVVLNFGRVRAGQILEMVKFLESHNVGDMKCKTAKLIRRLINMNVAKNVVGNQMHGYVGQAGFPGTAVASNLV